MQQQATSALFSSNPPQYLIQAHELQRNGRSPKSPRRLNLMSFEGVELVHHNVNRELHQAEKLVETAAQQNKTAFQFDTMTPKKPQNLHLEVAQEQSIDEEEHLKSDESGKLNDSLSKQLLIYSPSANHRQTIPKIFVAITHFRGRRGE